MELIGVGEAARRLGRSEARVRQLLRSGALSGQRVSGVWLVDATAIRERESNAPRPGRPLAPAHAWRVITAVDALASGQRLPPVGALADLAAGVVGGSRRRLVENLRRAPDVDRWRSWLAGRAVTRRYAATETAAYRLLSDGRVSIGGARGLAAASLLAARPGDGIDAYVREADAGTVIAAHGLEAEPTGAVRLRIVSDVVGAASGPVAGRPAPAAACLVDLLDSANLAPRTTGERRLRHVVDELHRLRDGPAP
ncbi:DNA-binding protein [Jiangella aurantiaca]|uniref:DNA-binding protein n=1 Tax=Jiangella aurantiaca TaxID=2530373 RepID=A0A4R5A436_9ACTN|nr:helix-turn-helix domain-containing protein [Jiangella aurantiaca]TDD65399.1 DNA-binding protein [Jiangella aurantiaca]